MDHNFMTASIPVHRLHVHVKRLVYKGYKVGVVKQTETAALKAAGDNKSGPFTRQLSALYTKSTLIGEDVDPVFSSDNTQSGLASSYLMAVYEPVTDIQRGRPHLISIVAVQPATGDLIYDQFTDVTTRSELETRISHISPVELLLPQSLSVQTEKVIKQVAALSTTSDDCMRIERIQDSSFAYDQALQDLTEFYKDKTHLDSPPSSHLSEILQLPKSVQCCLCGLLSYLRDFNLHHVLKLTSQFQKFSVDSGFMKLPARSVQNLELFQNETDCKEKGSLFWVMNHTRTKFGGRMMRQWLAKPLLNICDIEARLDAVQCCRDNVSPILDKMKGLLHQLPDIEKGLGTIYHKKCSTSEFLSVCKALHTVLKTTRIGLECTQTNLQSSLLNKTVTDLPELLEDIEQWVSDIDDNAAREGDKTKLFVKESNFPVILERKQEIGGVLLELRDHRKEVRLALRVPALEYVTVAGTEFLVEVRNTNVKLVPDDWVKIQSTKAVSRFHTPFIVAAYKRLNQYREQLKLDCENAWQTFLCSFAECYPRYKRAVQHLANLDCLFSLAQLAKQDGFVRPCLVPDKCQIEIEQGRHPVVDSLIGEHQQFVPNDTHLQQEGQRCMVITGPNMGGKSSYIKQVALIVIMAQMGSFVPAHSAKLGIVDAVYTRMGAADELFKGRSTFMVELQEASDILASATASSLIILDELGRGTSTHDGVAIALATLRYFVEKMKCLTLFVTHYPPLTELENLYRGHVANYHMSFMVNDESDNTDYDVITFLYQLIRGKAASSYGLNVARLADIPADILQVAACKSKHLEREVMYQRKQKSLFCGLLSADQNTIQNVIQDIQAVSQCDMDVT